MNHKSARELRLVQALANTTTLLADQIEPLIEMLQSNDTLLAELIAVTARPGPATNDSDWEFHPGSVITPRAWLHGGSGLAITHHLPEPNDP